MSDRNAREMGTAVYGAVLPACGGASERSFDRRIKCFCACDRTCCAERDCVNRGGGTGEKERGGSERERGRREVRGKGGRDRGRERRTGGRDGRR